MLSTISEAERGHIQLMPGDNSRSGRPIVAFASFALLTQDCLTWVSNAIPVLAMDCDTLHLFEEPLRTLIWYRTIHTYKLRNDTHARSNLLKQMSTLTLSYH